MAIIGLTVIISMVIASIFAICLRIDRLEQPPRDNPKYRERP